MELHLSGGRSYNGQKHIYWKLIREFVISRQLDQILFIGTASETHPGPEAKKFFMENIQLPDKVRVLDAEIDNELKAAKNPLIYVLGGKRHLDLLGFILGNRDVEDRIRDCSYYFGESAGAKIVGSKLRIDDAGSPLVPGLNILGDTIIEGHYTQKNRQAILQDEVREGSLMYGLGIDEDAEVITNPSIFPRYQKNGPGNVELIIR